MAQDDLVGNMPTERLVKFAMEQNEALDLKLDELQTAQVMFRQLVSH
jgi:hydroxymethylglutaryl-CoA lyase